MIHACIDELVNYACHSSLKLVGRDGQADRGLRLGS